MLESMDTQILNALQKRYATKLFDTEKKVSRQTLDTLLEAMRLSPSSLGVQPWKFLVISDPEIRSQLKKAAWDQPQITDASHLIVFTRRTDIKENHIDKVVHHTASERGQELSAVEGYKQMIEGSLAGLSAEAVGNWAAKQCYIPLGIALETAALLNIDACPMEGFDHDAFDKILGLSEKNLASVVICAVGYRSEKDAYATAKKVRFAKEDSIEFI